VSNNNDISLLNTLSRSYKEERREIVLSVFVDADEGEGRPERVSVPAQGTGAAPRCLLTHPPDAISIASALKEIYGDICVAERVSGPPLRECGVYMGLYGLIGAAGERVCGGRAGVRERGGGGERQRITLRQNHSTSTARQSIDKISKKLG